MVPGANDRPKQESFGTRKLSRLIARLENKVIDRRLKKSDTLEFDWLSQLTDALLGSTQENGQGGIKVIDFSEVPSDILPLIVSMVARLAIHDRGAASSGFVV